MVCSVGTWAAASRITISRCGNVPLRGIAPSRWSGLIESYSSNYLTPAGLQPGDRRPNRRQAEPTHYHSPVGL